MNFLGHCSSFILRLIVFYCKCLSMFVYVPVDLNLWGCNYIYLQYWMQCIVQSKRAQIFMEWMIGFNFLLNYAPCVGSTCTVSYPVLPPSSSLISQQSPDTLPWFYKMSHTLTCWPWTLQSSSLLPPHVLNQLPMQPTGQPLAVHGAVLVL